MNPVPVFMYHTVGIQSPSWKWNHLTIPYQQFERQLKFLKRKNYHTVHLDELYNSIDSGIPLPSKTIILTFDDGYADNYIFAYPLLKKYGFKGTIFVNPEFVDPRQFKRKRIDQVSDPLSLDTTGFLTWEEMLEMESDGTIDIQSHALTHTWYPISDKIIDFRHPSDEYCWMTWNDFPSEKPFLQLDNSELVKLGTPVYQHEKSLMCKRYFPDPNLDEYLHKVILENGAGLFFNQTNWKEQLWNELNNYRAKNEINGYYETDEERFLRLQVEIINSKKILEEKLHKSIRFLCWPGGSGTIEGHSIAMSAGYKMTTAARDIHISDRRKIKNDGIYLKDRIGRTSPILYQKNINGCIQALYCDEFGIWLRILSFSYSGIFQKILNATIILYGKIFAR